MHSREAKQAGVAEDELEIAQIRTFYLECNGFRTRSTADVRSVLMHHRMMMPDLILPDIQLPKQDGVAVLT